MCYETVERMLNIDMNIRDSTKDNYRVTLNKILDKAKEKLNVNTEEELLQKINVDTVEDLFLDSKKEDWKKSTFNNKIMIFQKYCKYLVNKGIKEKNISATLQRYKELDDKKIKDYLTLEEVNKVIRDSYDFQKGIINGKRIGSRMRLIIALGSTTGMRIEEILNITFDRMEKFYINNEFVGYIVGFNKKQNKGKTNKRVPICGETLKLLNEYIEEVRNKIKIEEEYKNYLFISDKGKKLSKSTVENNIEKFVRVGGIEKTIVPHSLRKTFRTVLTSKGINENIIRIIGGWKLDVVTSAYVDLTDEEKFSICDFLDK